MIADSGADVSRQGRFVIRPATIQVAALGRYTIPVHLLLPWVLWGLTVIDPAAPMWFFVAVHGLFPVAVVATYPWWRGQGMDLALLVAVNHAATFLSGAVAGWVASMG